MRTRPLSETGPGNDTGPARAASIGKGMRMAAAVGAVAVVGLAVSACSSPDDEPASGTILLDDDGLAPALADIQGGAAQDSVAGVVFTAFDGEQQSFGAYAGAPLVINFFARSCPPCVAEMPHLQAAAEEYAQDVSVVGISLDPQRSDAEALVAQTGVTYDLGWDPDGELFERFGALAMPTTVFVDSDGRVAELWSGVLTPADLSAKIEALA